MHKLALAGLLAASGLLTGCVNQPQSLYYWNGYQEQVYARFKGEGSSPQEQVAALEASLQEARLQQVFSLAEHPDSIAQVAQVLQAQERDYRQALQALKRGMRDLANMLPGSRSWLSDYEETLQQTLEHSQQRSENLLLWAEQARQAALSKK